MAAPVIPCDSCGSPISDSDLETGTAITLLGKRYCSACKTEAIQSVSLDDLSPRASAARPGAPKPAPRPPAAPTKAAPASPRPADPKPAPRTAHPPPASPATRGDRKVQARPAGRGPRPPSRSWLPLAGLAAGVVVVVGAYFAFRSESRPPGTGAPEGVPSASSGAVTSKNSPANRESQAREAYAKVEELSHRQGIAWDLLVAAAEKARPACRGTEWESKLEEIRSKAKHEKEVEDTAKELAPLVDELKGAVATDPEFKRYAELQPKFQLALEMAGKTSSVKMSEIRALHKEYTGKYEKLAEPYYDRINEAATSLAEEHRYDDALRQIDSFPQHLRNSGAWLTLERLRKDIERRKQAQPKK